jgi:hypothetical protein
MSRSVVDRKRGWCGDAIETEYRALVLAVLRLNSVVRYTSIAPLFN